MPAGPRLLLRQGATDAIRSAPIKCVAFDLTCTLIRFTESASAAYAEQARRALREIGWEQGAAPDAARIEGVFPECYASVTERYPSFGYARRMTCEAWWRVLVRESLAAAGYRYPPKVFEAVFQRIYRYYGEADAYEVYPDAVPTLEALRASGVVVAALTNNCRRATTEIIPMLGLDAHLDFAMASQEVGAQKPDVEFFTTAMQRARAFDPTIAAPHEMLYVGDHYTNDYCGARRAGLKALLLLRNTETRSATVAAMRAMHSAPEYPGRAADALAPWVIGGLHEVVTRLAAA